MERVVEQSYVSAAENPEATNAAVKALLNPVPAIPKIVIPSSMEVILPGGYIDLKGELHTTAEVKELTGADEEALFKAEVTKNPGRFIATLLARGVRSVGSLEAKQAVLGGLLIGDRDALLLAIRRATYGDSFDFQTVCPSCSEEMKVNLDLASDVPCTMLDDPMQRVFPLTLRSGTVVFVYLPTGSVQEEILNSGNKSISELNTLLLGRTVYVDIKPIGLDGARNLGLADRHMLLTFLAENQPGPKYSEIKLECPRCARDFPVTVDTADLFRAPG